MTDNKKGPNMYTRRNSLNITLEPYISPRKTAVSVCSSPKKIQSTCRICLQQCPLVEVCDCRGSSMVHIDCLKQYIAKGQGDFKSKSKCEICGTNFNLIFDKHCKFSCQNGLNYIKTSIITSVLFSIFSVLTIIYIGYCLYINSKGDLDDNLQLVLLIVGVCLILVFLVVLIRWVYLYMFTTVYTIRDIQPSRKGSIELTLDNLNDSQQYIK